MTKSIEELEIKVNSQEKEIVSLKSTLSKVETFLQEKYTDFNKKSLFTEPEVNQKVIAIEKPEPEVSNPIDFTTVITSIGVIGLIIGIISFFFYAVARGWINEFIQVLIGVVLGLTLMTLGLRWYQNKPSWSTTLIGGGIFIVMLSILIGVNEYKVIHQLLGLFVAIGVIAYTLYISIKLNSRVITYFGLLGGFLIPPFSGIGSHFFLYTYLTLFLVAMLYLSFIKHWTEIRFVSFIFMFFYNIVYFDPFSSSYPSGIGPELSLLFLIIITILFHISSFVYSLKEKVQIRTSDITLMNINSIIFAITLAYLLYDSLSNLELGIVYFGIGILFLLEYFTIRSSSLTNNLLNSSLLSSIIIFTNIGITTAFDFSLDYLLFFVYGSQWIAYMYLSKIAQSTHLKIYGYISLAIVLFWYLFDLRFSEGITHGTFFILALLVIPLLSFKLSKDGIEKNFHQFLTIGFMFLWFYSFTKYLAFFNIGELVLSLILSLLWLTYSLLLIIKTHNSEVTQSIQTSAKFLLGFVLLKIAFIDLIQLSGIVRIIGFMLFGIFLVLGGFLLKKK